MRFSPLGDPIPFSAHLIGQLANNAGYSTQFNLDSDRAFAYLNWDWIRNDPHADGGSATGIFGLTHATRVEPPQEASGWAKGSKPLLLKYKDPQKIDQPQPGPVPPPVK